MHADLLRLLSLMRRRRKFDPHLYLSAKILLLNNYLKRSGLRSCVVGVSGGVDSALTLAILQKASQVLNSPLEKIVCALVPMHIEAGTTRQDEATRLGRETVKALGGKSILIDLSLSHQEMKTTVDQALGIKGEAWAAGQLVSNIRTPSLYYASSLLTQSGFPSIVIGTTNRDEGSYIGYFGKAADALVDLQLISDLHKREVYTLAKILNVPRSVLQADPTGDIYDGRNDEELIGATYDSIELYTQLRCLDLAEAKIFRSDLSSDADSELLKISNRLDTLNRQCAHKYLGGSVAVHLDVYARAVPGGWRIELNSEDVETYLSRAENFVGEFQFPQELIGDFCKNKSLAKGCEPIKDFRESLGKVSHLLSPEECKHLVLNLSEQNWEAVGTDGILKNYRSGLDPTGSYRATTFNETLSKMLWKRLEAYLPPLRIMSEETPTDCGEDFVWRPIGISPVLRFIRYKNEGLLVPHYDSSFEYWEGRKTLMSVVIYLTESQPEEGGATRFILDPQRHLPQSQKNFQDWNRLAKEHEIYHAVQPEQGSAIYFDHRILHDSEPLHTQREKIILRTDIIFERCGSRRTPPACASKALGFPDSKQQPISRTQEEIDSRTLSKVNEDPYYKQVWENFGSRSKLMESGFFDDELPIGASHAGILDTKWMSTPVNKILKKWELLSSSQNEKWPVVLISTGGFSPIHRSHVEMMELAKAELEKKGALVLGGYLSPSHDCYVQSKSSDEMLDAQHRIHLCEQAVAESEWLMVDSWESVYNRTSLNFTVVIRHLEAYLAAHIQCHQAIKVFYVYGSDNAGFSYAFLEQGGGVCVKRPGHEEKFKSVSEDLRLRDSKRVHFVQTPTSQQDISSRLVRMGEESFLHERVLSLFKIWQQGRTQTKRVPATYYIRDEERQSILPWMKSRKLEESTVCFQALDRFKKGLLEVLKNAFAAVKGPGTLFDIEFKIFALSEQYKIAAGISEGHKSISLDPYIKGDCNLAVSRRFPISAAKGDVLVVARPGYPSIQEQVDAIPSGSYVLIDDDIATGTTMRQVQSYFPAHIQIKQCLALFKLEEHVRNQRLPLDILDFRDFLCGTKEGGLVAQLPSFKDVRAPYILPYVSPSDRASIPLSQNLEMSRNIWKLNLDFFQSIQPQILLHEVDESFRHLMIYVGFEEHDSLEKICAWHLEKLSLNSKLCDKVE